MIQNLIMGIVMCLGGAYLMFLGLKIKKKIKTARSWPVIEGKITRLETIGMGPKVVGTDDYRRYMLRVAYEYDIDGQNYQNNRPVFGSSIEVKNEVDEFCSLYNEGEKTDIHYNPKNPKDSVLMLDRPGRKQSREFYFGVFLIFFGLIIAVAGGGYLS